MNLKITYNGLNNKCGLAGEKPIIVGVSGGPDSLCLLDMLVQAGVPVIAAHYNHQLRSNSGEDAALVCQMAFDYGVPFRLGEGDVTSYALNHKLAIEEAARDCRYRFLFDTARLEGAEAVAVAHSADDQVETVLMHLLRGAGLSGLKGMTYRSVLVEWDAVIPVVRPLLGVWREEILAYCQTHQLKPVTDPSNMDTTYFRNKLRHELLPYLAGYNSQIKKTLWRMAQSLESDLEILQDDIQNKWNDVFLSATQQAVILKFNKLSKYSTGIQRNFLRKAFSTIRPALRDINFDAVERAIEFIAHPSRSGQMDLIDGIWLIKMGDELLIGSRDAALVSQDWPQMGVDQVGNCLTAGRVELGNGWHLCLEIVNSPIDKAIYGADSHQAWFALDQLAQPLMLRVRAAGDRFKPFGMAGHQMKLSDFFINEHVPAAARKNYPLVCSGNDIIWIPGIRSGETGRASAITQKMMHISLIREE